MNEPRLPPDDPRLTAYALGELEPDEAAKIEAALRSDPTARETVARVRAAAQQIEAALQAEVTAGAEIEPMILPVAAVSQARDALEIRYARKRGWARLVRFPQFYFVISGAAAAAFVLVMFQSPGHPEPSPLDPIHGELTAARRGRAIVEARNEVLRGKLALYEAQYGAVVEPGSSTAATAEAANADAARPAPVLESTTGVAALKLPLLAQAAEMLAAGWTGPAWVGIHVAIPEPSATAAPDNGNVVAGSGALAANPSQDAVVTASSLLGGGGFSPIVPGEWAELFAQSESYVPRILYDPMPAAPASKARRGTTANESDVLERENEFLGVWQNPYSTFSVDVDTASYGVVRRFLQEGKLPPADAVRIEELLNYFPYRYDGPATGVVRGGAQGAPFAAALEVSEAPWAPSHRLVRIGLKGREVSPEARSPANLVFLLDVSSSMYAQSRLPLVKASLRLLLGKLRTDDRVAIVTYAGRSGLALPSTPAENVPEILTALETLIPRRSTNMAVGIQLAYDIAAANFVVGGINRVVLCTDGDFNVGVTNEADLMRLVEEKARGGTYLSALGFGMGRFRDATLEKLAGKGHGHYGYIDSQRDADYILSEQVNGTLMTIAKDVKIQVQFNPRKVASYRLIGFEDRMPARKYFKSDRIDAGEVGVGHTMTALYEIVPADEFDYADLLTEVDDLKYQEKPVKAKKANLTATVEGELLTVFLRYKEPSADESKQLEFAMTDPGRPFEAASPDFKFAAAVAQFGMQLRKSPHKGTATVDNIIEWATAGADSSADDPGGLRREFIDLARRADSLMQ